MLVGGRNVTPDEVPRRQRGPGNRDIRLLKRGVVSSVPNDKSEQLTRKIHSRRDHVRPPTWPCLWIYIQSDLIGPHRVPR